MITARFPERATEDLKLPLARTWGMAAMALW